MAKEYGQLPTDILALDIDVFSLNKRIFDIGEETLAEQFK